jgi:diadenosine tetraphosphate (Ap4A) HIT family hydrolase
MTDPQACPLCKERGGKLLWQSRAYRIVLVDEAGYPGFCRVIWQTHVREMSDLDDAARQHLMGVVWALESVMREHLQPDKINLASLGNMVPHLHWHVIPRWQDDPHFPDPIWAPPRRTPVERTVDLDGFAAALASRLLLLEAAMPQEGRS